MKGKVWRARDSVAARGDQVQKAKATARWQVELPGESRAVDRPRGLVGKGATATVVWL